MYTEGITALLEVLRMMWFMQCPAEALTTNTIQPSVSYSITTLAETGHDVCHVQSSECYCYSKLNIHSICTCHRFICRRFSKYPCHIYIYLYGVPFMIIKSFLILFFNIFIIQQLHNLRKNYKIGHNVLYQLTERSGKVLLNLRTSFQYQ